MNSPRGLVDGFEVAGWSGHVSSSAATGVAKPTELTETFDDGDHVAGCGEGGHEGEKDVEVERAWPGRWRFVVVHA